MISSPPRLESARDVANALLQTPRYWKFFFGSVVAALFLALIVAIFFQGILQGKSYSADVFYKKNQEMTHNAQIAFAHYDLPQRSRNISNLSVESVAWIPEIATQKITELQNY